MPGLGASFGRGAATTYQQDLANSDCVLFMGSNMAEAHPVGFRWPMKAKERARSSSTSIRASRARRRMCDVFVGIRAGSDIAFLGGLVNYVLSHERWFKEYVLTYTNAATIIEDGFQDTEELDGLFSGFQKDGETGKYERERAGGDTRARRSEGMKRSAGQDEWRGQGRSRRARPWR